MIILATAGLPRETGGRCQVLVKCPREVVAAGRIGITVLVVAVVVGATPRLARNPRFPARRGGTGTGELALAPCLAGRVVPGMGVPACLILTILTRHRAGKARRQRAGPAVGHVLVG